MKLIDAYLTGVLMDKSNSLTTKRDFVREASAMTVEEEESKSTCSWKILLRLCTVAVSTS